MYRRWQKKRMKSGLERGQGAKEKKEEYKG